MFSFKNISVCVIAFFLCLLPMVSQAANNRPMIFGMNSTSTAQWGYDPVVWDDILYDKMAAAGCASARASAGWDVVEVNQGTFDFTEIDAKVKLRLDHNIEPVVLMGGTPVWALPSWANPNIGNGFYPASDTKIAEFQNYCTQLARHLRGRARFYEFWNEANGYGWFTAYNSPPTYNRADLYTPWMIRAYKALKLTDPTCRMSTTGIDNANGAGFLGDIYKYGGKNNFDAVCEHPYAGQGPFDLGKLRTLRNKMLQYDDANKDVWFTEYGYNMNESQYPMYQQYMTDCFNALTTDEFNYVKIAHWHTANEFKAEPGFGLIWSEKEGQPFLTPKPPYYTYQNYPKPSRPVISNISVSGVSQYDATVTFTTNIASTGLVMYGPDDKYGLITGRETTNTTSHTFNLIGLVPNTTYHFRIRVGAVDYGDSFSLDQTFTTISGPMVNITTAPHLVNVTETTATISWVTDVDAKGTVECGTNFNYGNKVSVTALSKNHTITVTGLQSGTNYQYRVKSGLNLNGTVYGTAVQEGSPFTTLADFNLLKNGGFEQALDSTVWYYWQVESLDFRGTQQDGAHEGLNFLLLADYNRGPAIGGVYQNCTAPNGEYLVSGWMLHYPDNNLAEIRAFDGQYTSGYSGGVVIASTTLWDATWRYYAKPITITTGKLTVSCGINATGGWLWGSFDDLRVRPLIRTAIGQFKTQPMGSCVATSADGVVTMIVDATTFYMQSENRSSGIMVQCVASHGLQEGDRTSVIGSLKKSGDGEACIGEAFVTKSWSGSVPTPLCLRTDTLGGGDNGSQGAVISFPSASDRTAKASAGVNNIGLLVKIVGKVTYVGSGYFYVDDGTNIDDGDPAIKGVKVMYACPGQVGDIFSVTGISSCFMKSDNAVRQIKPRRGTDIVEFP